MIKEFISKFLNRLGYKINKIEKPIPNTQISDIQKIEELLNVKIDINRFNYVGQCYIFIKNLKEKKNAKFYFNHDFKVEIDNFQFFINSWEEMLILNEIFIEGIYNISFNEDFTLFDIGLNVGFTSLFFAEKENCINTFSFEPFKRTVDFANKNFAINSFSKKINAYNFGLGSVDKTLEIDYNENFKGSMGLNGLANYIQDSNDFIKTQLHIKDISKFIEENKHLFAKKVIAKIDCEGSEYEIFTQLDKNSQIDTFDYYLIEWHIKGPESIINILKKHNYKILSFNESANDIGMIYAFK